jgi:hypothetical protein
MEEEGQQMEDDREVKEETRNILKGKDWDSWRNQPATKTNKNVAKLRKNAYQSFEASIHVQKEKI